MELKVKAALDGDVRRFSTVIDGVGALKAKLLEVYNPPCTDLVVKYTDDEGDLVTLETTAELEEAVAVANASSNGVLRVKLSLKDVADGASAAAQQSEPAAASTPVNAGPAAPRTPDGAAASKQPASVPAQASTANVDSGAASTTARDAAADSEPRPAPEPQRTQPSTGGAQGGFPAQSTPFDFTSFARPPFSDWNPSSAPGSGTGSGFPQFDPFRGTQQQQSGTGSGFPQFDPFNGAQQQQQQQGTQQDTGFGAGPWGSGSQGSPFDMMSLLSMLGGLGGGRGMGGMGGTGGMGGMGDMGGMRGMGGMGGMESFMQRLGGSVDIRQLAMQAFADVQRSGRLPGLLAAAPSILERLASAVPESVGSNPSQVPSPEDMARFSAEVRSVVGDFVSEQVASSIVSVGEHALQDSDIRQMLSGYVGQRRAAGGAGGQTPQAGARPSVPASPLRRDDRGPDVERLHQCLANLGYLDLSRLGSVEVERFGEHTELALLAFQADCGLVDVEDGVYDNTTRVSMESLYEVAAA